MVTGQHTLLSLPVLSHKSILFCREVKMNLQRTRGVFPNLIVTSLPSHRLKVERNLKAAATLLTVIGLKTRLTSGAEDEVAMGTAGAAVLRGVPRRYSAAPSALIETRRGASRQMVTMRPARRGRLASGPRPSWRPLMGSSHGALSKTGLDVAPVRPGLLEPFEPLFRLKVVMFVRARAQLHGCIGQRAHARGRGCRSLRCQRVEMDPGGSRQIQAAPASGDGSGRLLQVETDPGGSRRLVRGLC